MPTIGGTTGKSRAASDREGTDGRRRADGRTRIILTVVFAVAVLIRLPGLLWGYDPHTPDRLRDFHPDEGHFALMAGEFVTGVTNQAENYPKGFGFQVGVLARGVEALTTAPPLLVRVLIGRMLSILYGGATVILVFVLARRLTVRPAAAPAAALFVSLSGLHVVESHYATADAANTFWLYATMLAVIVFIRRAGNTSLALAIAATGIGLSLKLTIATLFPLIYGLVRQKTRLATWVLTSVATAAVFWAANGGHYTWHNWLLTVGNVVDDNVNAIPRHVRLWNVPVYAAEIVAGVGLPVALLACVGAGRVWKDGSALAVLRRADCSASLVAGTLLLYGLSTLSIDVPFTRHMLPLCPAVALAGAYGWARWTGSEGHPRGGAWLLVAVLVYQAIYVGSIEHYYLDDTRDAAWAWISRNIPAGAEVAATPYTEMPLLSERYRVTDTFDTSPYVVLHEAYYYRYRRSVITPETDFPSEDQVYHGTRGDLESIQRLLKGDPGHVLLKAFPVRAITPELYLYKRAFGTYPLFVGDVLIFAVTPQPAQMLPKNRRPARDLETGGPAAR